ncbi:glycosyl transferase, partial [Streptomyces zhihengii]
GFPGGGGSAGGRGNGFPGGAGDGTDGNGTGTGTGTDGTGFPGGGRGQGGQDGTGRGGGGGMGGLLNGADVAPETAAALTGNADDYTWAAAAIGSQNAASYQLATEKPVMAIGGFNGSDPSPTLAQFKQYVADGRIHWFIAGGGMGGAGAPGGGGAETGGTGAGGGLGGPGGGTSAEISAWVQETFTQVTVGGATLYDLTDPQ